MRLNRNLVLQFLILSMLTIDFFYNLPENCKVYKNIFFLISLIFYNILMSLKIPFSNFTKRNSL